MRKAPAFEEGLSQFGFELRDLHAESGLYDIEPLGRARGRTILEEGYEILDLLEVHDARSTWESRKLQVYPQVEACFQRSGEPPETLDTRLRDTESAGRMHALSPLKDAAGRGGHHKLTNLTDFGSSILKGKSLSIICSDGGHQSFLYAIVLPLPLFF